MPPKKKTDAATDKAEKPKKAKATKAKAKGSPKAKKPLSGYMLFAKEMRPTIKEENPELSFGELGKELGARWRALSDEEKAKYKKN